MYLESYPQHRRSTGIFSQNYITIYSDLKIAGYPNYSHLINATIIHRSRTVSSRLSGKKKHKHTLVLAVAKYNKSH